jgi:hypothetical protein
MRTVLAPRRLIALSAAIYAAVGFEQEFSEGVIKPVTFPAEIYGLELDSLLHLVKVLASTHPDLVGRYNAERTHLSTVAKVADAAARVLQNWPCELYRNLDCLLPATVSKSADLNPRIVFGVLYRRLLKELPRDRFKFLHDVIEEFVIRNWKGPVYRTKPNFLMGNRGQLKWYTLTEAKTIAHRSVGAMKQLVGSGAVNSKTLRETAGRQRIFVERQSLDNLLKADQPHICYSEVKRFLGLSNPETLSLLKAGIIRCERSGDIDTRINPKDRYLLEDVLAIKESFASASAQTADSLIGKRGPVMSLKEAITSRFINTEKGFPWIIRSVMLHRIQPIMQFNNSSDVMAYAFRVDDLTPFKRETSSGVEIAPPGYMSYGEAAGVIGVKRDVIGQLVTHRHLTAVGRNGRSKLLRSADVRRFAAKYVPLAAAARLSNITSESLVSSLESSSIPYLNIPTYFYHKPTLLIPRRACAKVSKSL